MSVRQLTSEEILERVVSPALLGRFPRVYLSRHLVLPLGARASGPSLDVVLAGSPDLKVLDEIKLVTGVPELAVFRTTEAVLLDLLERFYPDEDGAGGDGDGHVDESDLYYNPLETIAPAEGREELDVLDTMVAAADSPPPTVETRSRSAIPSPRPGKKRIAIIHDDSAIRVPLARILEREGWGVRQARSVRELLDELWDDSVDLVVAHAPAVDDPLVLERKLRRLNPECELRLLEGLDEVLQGEPVRYAEMSRFLFQILDLLVSLLDTGGGEATGLTHALADVAGKVADELGLKGKLADEVRLGAYLSDLGRALLAFRKRQLGPGAGPAPLAKELVEQLDPPYDVAPVLEAIGLPYARGDADPSAPRGVEIPIAARVLTVAREYLQLSRQGGAAATIRNGLRMEAGKRFDPRVVEALLRVIESGRTSARPVRDLVLVEPDGAQATLLEMRFTNDGYRVRVLADGARALESIRAQPPDLVISEVLLSGRDGYSLLENLQEDLQLRGIPFFFVSSRGDTFSVTKGLELGATDFLAKPVNLEVLVTKARRAVAAAKRS